jgi:Putative inner membrane protein (DUF1819)
MGQLRVADGRGHFGIVMNRQKSQPTGFRARLTEAGLAVEDSSHLCLEYVKTQDWKEVRRRAVRENLLDKGSEARITKLLRAVERRVIGAMPPLPCPRLVARFLASNVSDAAKAQLLFVLATREDVALAEAYQRLVLPHLQSGSRKVPAKLEILAFLEEAAQTRPEVAKWTNQTRLRWAEGFRLVLREVGVMTESASNHEALNLPTIRVEAVCFLCHAVAGTGITGWAILRHEIMKLLLPNDADAVRAARSMQDRGWWTFAQNNEFVEFRRSQPSLEDWMNHALGS